MLIMQGNELKLNQANLLSFYLIVLILFPPINELFCNPKETVGSGKIFGNKNNE